MRWPHSSHPGWWKTEQSYAGGPAVAPCESWGSDILVDVLVFLHFFCSNVTQAWVLRALIGV